jgi:acetoin utilization protein AcuB
MRVESMMFRDPLFIRPEATFHETQAFMRENGIRHLPVADKDKNILGIVTDRDMRSASPSDAGYASDQELRYRLRRLRVSDIMTPVMKLVTVASDTIVEKAVKVMHDHKFGSLPVVDDGKLVGLVTLTDILGFFVDVMGLDVEGTRLTMTMGDVPGQLVGVLRVVEKYRANVISIFSPTTLKDGKRHAVMRIQTRDSIPIVEELNAGGYEVLTVDVWQPAPRNPGPAKPPAPKPATPKPSAPKPAAGKTVAKKNNTKKRRG